MTINRIEGTTKNATRIGHIIPNVLLEPKDAGVVAKVYRLVSEIGEPGKPNSLAAAGNYFDLLVKTPQGWLYKEKWYFGNHRIPDEARRLVAPGASVAPSRFKSPIGQSAWTRQPHAMLSPEDYAQIQQLYARSAPPSTAQTTTAALTQSCSRPTAARRMRTEGDSWTRPAGGPGARSGAGGAKGPTNVQTFLFAMTATPSPGGANGNAYVTKVTFGRPGEPLTMNDGGQFHDALVKTAEGWKFKTRKFVRAVPGATTPPPPSATARR